MRVCLKSAIKTTSTGTWRVPLKHWHTGRSVIIFLADGNRSCFRNFYTQTSNVQKVNGTYKFREKRLVSFDPPVVYSVVSDVATYEEFLPWISKSTIVKKISPTEFLAELDIGFNFFSEQYVSRVTMSHDCNNLIRDDQYMVKAIAEGSPLFDELVTEWKLKQPKKRKNSCEIAIAVSFKFRSKLYETAADMFIEKVVARMVDSFLSRCQYMIDNDKISHLKNIPTKTELKEELLKNVSAEELTLMELESLSHFSKLELARVKDRFDRALRKQGHEGSTTLSKDAFVDLFMDLFYWSPKAYVDLDTTLHKISSKVLLAIAHHQFNALDVNSDGVVDLREFVAGMSIMLKGTALEKCRLWFRCYDLDRDGLVSVEELERMLKATMAVRTALIIAIKANSGKVLNPKEVTAHLLSVNNEAVADVLTQSFGDLSLGRKFSLEEVELSLISKQNQYLFSID